MRKLRTYEVAYYIEQGYAIEVQARSPAHAEKLIRARLDEEMDKLDNSRRVHHEDGICQVLTAEKSGTT